VSVRKLLNSSNGTMLEGYEKMKRKTSSSRSIKESEYCDISNGTCIDGGCMQGGKHLNCPTTLESVIHKPNHPMESL